MRIPTAPLQLTWDPTNRCSARCIHCYNASGADEAEEDDDGLLEKTLASALRARPLTMGIGGGDPLLFSGLERIVETLHDTLGGHMPSLIIGTNGFLLPKRLRLIRLVADIYRRAPFAVLFYVSLHGSTPEINDTVMAVKGAFDLIMSAAKLLREWDLPFGVGVTPLRVNAHDLDGIVEVALKIGATCVNVSQFVPTGRGNANLDLTPEGYRELTAWVANKNRELGRTYVLTHEHYVAMVDDGAWVNDLFVGCTAGIYQLAVRPNGDIVPCPLLPVVVGNVRTDELTDVWEDSEVLAALRRRKVAAPCGSCALKHKCGGCRSLAYAYTGDFLGPDTLCPYSKAEVREAVIARRQAAAAVFDPVREGEAPTRSRIDRSDYRKIPNPYKKAFPNEIVVLDRFRSQLVSLTGDASRLYEFIPDAGDHFASFPALVARFRKACGRQPGQGELEALVEAGLVELRDAACRSG